MKKPELLSPAGNFEKLKFALAFGADAVYVSGKGTGLRNFAENFSEDGLREAIEYTHSLNKKIYITANIFPHNADLELMKKHLKAVNEMKPDGVIISDLGVMQIIKEEKLSFPVHISVQANNVNYMEVKMWQKLGAARVILARELSFEEIKEIKQKVPDMELELFIHGAMCVSYSGRCLISNYLTGRDANRGECTQGCRWSYELTEAKRPGEKMSIAEDERGTYFFNSKDMNLIDKLKDFASIGIDSLKIEGRMKGIHYVAAVTNAYRRALDNDFAADDDMRSELNKVSHREYTTGFYFDDGKLKQNYKTSDYTSDSVYIGHAEKGGSGIVNVNIKNMLSLNDKIEIFSAAEKKHDIVTGIYDADGLEVIKTAGKPVYGISTKGGFIHDFSIIRKDID